MKHTIFTSLTAEKALALLQAHTAPTRKESQDYVWTPRKRSKKEWACLVGRWKGNAFRGKLFRHYNDQTSGGIALPRLAIRVESAGNLGRLQFRTGFSPAFWILIAAFVFTALLQAIQIAYALPDPTVISVAVLIGWILLCAMMFVLFYGQYRHECAAVESLIKSMTKAFD